MLRFFISRFAVLIPTFLGVSLIAFSFIRMLPGDPVMLLSGERVMAPERHAQIMHDLGFDRPMYVQYFDYLVKVLHGDLGTSIVTKRPVLGEFLTLFPATLELSLCAIIIAVCLGVPAGVFAAVKRGTWFDQSVMGVALIGYSMPIFWWGLLLIIFFSGYLGWTPVSGRISLMYFFKPVTGFMLIDSLLSGQKERSPRPSVTSFCRPSCWRPFRSPSSRARRVRRCSRFLAKIMSARRVPRA